MIGRPDVVVAHVGDPFAFNRDGLFFQNFSGVDIDHVGIDYGQIGFLLS